MPLFEFNCQDCETSFEEFTAYKDIHKVVCPKCKSPRVERRVSRIGGIHVHGSGNACPISPQCPAAGPGCGKGKCGMDV